MKRRIKALKRLQFQTQELEADFYLDVQKLEAKYQKLYQPLYDIRRDIITGSRDPTDEEAHWSEDDDEGRDACVVTINVVSVIIIAVDPLTEDKKEGESNGK